MTDTPQIVVAKHASSASGHWYDAIGSQINEVPKADGKGMKRVTLREARILGLAPGVTTITGCADKPALTKWKMRQAILAALTLPRMVGEAEDAWIERVVEDAGETARKAAEIGTEIHAAIQQSFQGVAFDQAYAPHVQGARQALLTIDPHATWIAEKGVASEYGYGTKIDLFSESWIVDWKGREMTTDDIANGKVRAYDEHAMQLAACRVCLDDRPTNQSRRCAIGFVSRSVPGLVHFVEIKQAELMQGWMMFLHLLRYWRERNDWRPSWATKE